MSESQIDRLEKMLNSEDPPSVTIRPDGTIEEIEVSTAVPVESDLRKAWDAYRATFAYERSKGWALQLAPFPTATERQRRFEVMPIEQRESNVEGALWAAFMTGWESALRAHPSSQERE
jgi:hypothetical protein